MAYPNGDRRWLSRPFPVRWAGWESTTTQLFNNGWQIACEMHYEDLTYRLAFHNDQLTLGAITESMHIGRDITDFYNYNADSQLPTFFISHVAPKIMISAPAVRDVQSVSDWMLVDGRPTFTYEPIRELADMCAFARLKTREILIPQANMSVVEQLEAIIKAQEPKQDELRKLILAERRAVRPMATLAQVA